MTQILLVISSLILTSCASGQRARSPSFGPPLTIERIFSSPDLDGSLSMNTQFSPDGEHLTFLKAKESDYEVLDLWEYDLKSGQPRRLVDSDSLKFGELSEVEKARRERQRISRKGITEYYWFNDGQRILLPVHEKLYVYNLADKSVKQLTKKSIQASDVRISRKDRFITFVQNQNLMMLDLGTGKIHSVTTDGKGPVSNGVAEFVAQEEMGRFTGYWISRDENYIAYTQIDESPVPLVDRYDIDADKVMIHKQRYPAAGSKNALVKLAIVRVADVLTGQRNPTWVPLGTDQDIYLTSAAFNSENKLIYHVQSRDQKTLNVFSYDPVAKSNQLIITETDSHWVNLNDGYTLLRKSPRFIWSSERSGFRHLYLYQNDGKLIRQLTAGEWQIDDLVGVDEELGWVYFTGSLKSPLELSFYRMPLEKPGEPELLTKNNGWNYARMSKKADVFLNSYSSPTEPPQVHLRKANGDLISTLLPNILEKGHPLFPYRETMITPEYGSFRIKTGDLIYYRLYKPHGFDPKKKYPLIVRGYGGPLVQEVSKGWNGKSNYITQVFLDRGFVVATFDNRGSARRGKKFESHLYRAFATVEVEDQVAGVEYLIAQGFVDPARVGFFGWSYGGYLGLALALKAPDTFKAVVAGAPVTDFALYDTHYTERYMGLPNTDAEAYKRANLLNFVPQLKAHLLVLHGMADDNVLFTNTTMLFKELQKNGKLYESVTYPGAKHGVYGKDNQIHLNKTVLDFFERRL